MPLRRKIIKLGNSKAITIPLDWLEEHERRVGHEIDSMLLEVDNVIVLAVPEKEEQNNIPPKSPAIKPEEEEVPLELDYIKIFKEDRVKIPASGDPVTAFLNGFDPISEQIKNLYPDYKISHVDIMTIYIEGQKYYQPSRIIIQHIKGIVPPIEE